MVICVEILDFMVMVLQEPDMKKKTESTMCFFNLHREDKVNKDGTVPLKVSYPKFKNGEATARSRKIKQNFGK